jgi:DNA primase
LRIVLQKPGLARELPVNLLPDTAERPALLLLHRLVTANPESSSYASLREQIRGLPEEALFESFAAELLGNPFDEGEAETEFRATLEKLQEGDQKRAFDELQTRVQRLGVAGLTPEEKQAYIRLSSREKRG